MPLLECPKGQAEEPETQYGDECVGGTRPQNAQHDGRHSHGQGDSFQNERDKRLIGHMDLLDVPRAGSAGMAIGSESEPSRSHEDARDQADGMTANRSRDEPPGWRKAVPHGPAGSAPRTR